MWREAASLSELLLSSLEHAIQLSESSGASEQLGALVRSLREVTVGQVHCTLTDRGRPKSETTRDTRQLRLPPRYHLEMGLNLASLE